MQTIEVGVVSIPVVVIYTKMFVAALFCALWEQEKKAFFLLQLRIDSICSFTCRQVGLLPDLSHQPSDCRVVHPICSRYGRLNIVKLLHSSGASLHKRDKVTSSLSVHYRTTVTVTAQAH